MNPSAKMTRVSSCLGQSRARWQVSAFSGQTGLHSIVPPEPPYSRYDLYATCGLSIQSI